MKIYAKLFLIISILIGINFSLLGCSLSKYNVNVASSNSSAGSVSGSGAYRVGKEVTITAETLDSSSFEWRGWFLNDKFYTMEETFTYTVQGKNANFEAHWSGININLHCYSNLENNYTHVTNSDIILSYVSSSAGLSGIEYGKTITIYDPKMSIEGYSFLGWYSDINLQNKVTESDGVLNNSPFKTQTSLYAKWKIKKSTLSLTSNSNLTQFSIYLKNSNNEYVRYEQNDMQFVYGAKLKIEFSNFGLTDGQNTFKQWSNNQSYQNFTIEENTILILTIPETDLEFVCEFNLNETGFEYDTSGNECILVQHYGSEKTVNIPFSFMNKNVTTIGSNAFKNSSCEKIILTSKITTIQKDAFKNVKAQIYFDEGAKINLITDDCFTIDNAVFVNINDGYDLLNSPSSINKEFKALVDGYGFVLLGNAGNNKSIKTQEEFDIILKYCYLYNIDKEFIFTCETNITPNYDFRNLYTTNVVIPVTDSFVHIAGNNYKFAFQKRFENIDDLASINSLTQYNIDIETDENLASQVTFNTIPCFYEGQNSSNPNTSRSLAVENFKTYTQCETSEQLLYAIENKSQPLFLNNNSVAKKVYDKAKTILKTIIDDSMTDYEKTLAIHDYILNHTIIDDYFIYCQNKPEQERLNRYMYRSSFLESVLLDGVAELSSASTPFTKALSLLLSMEGVENSRYLGLYKIGATENDLNNAQYNGQFVWNKVKLNLLNQNQWFNIDLAREKKISTDYELNCHAGFLISDTDMDIILKNDTTTLIRRYYTINENFVSLLSYRQEYYEDSTIFDGTNTQSLFIDDIYSSEIYTKCGEILSTTYNYFKDKDVQVEFYSLELAINTTNVETLNIGDLKTYLSADYIFQIEKVNQNNQNEKITILVLLYYFAD